jgi:hypothetical protein
MSIFTPPNKAPSGDGERQVEGAQNSLHSLKGFSIRREVFLACTLSISAQLHQAGFAIRRQEKMIFPTLYPKSQYFGQPATCEKYGLTFNGVRAYVHCCRLPQFMLKAEVRIGSKISYVR